MNVQPGAITCWTDSAMSSLANKDQGARFIARVKHLVVLSLQFSLAFGNLVTKAFGNLVIDGSCSQRRTAVPQPTLSGWGTPVAQTPVSILLGVAFTLVLSIVPTDQFCS